MKKASWIINDRKIKIALVGCGRIALNHFTTIKAHAKNLELLAVCDHNAAVLQRTVDEQKVPGYLTLNEMLQHSDADIVAVCTPSGVHHDNTLTIAAAGKHVITEKPMATRWSHAMQMVSACDKADVRLFVVKQNRHNPTLQLLKRAIEQGRFGKIYLANINVFWTRPQDYYDAAAWRGTWEYDGGALMNQASHYVDLLHWLIGPVQSVQAMTATLARQIATEDTAVLNIRWRSGTLGSVNVTMLTYPKNLEGSITILGEQGSVKIGGVAVNEIQHWEFAQSLPEDREINAANYETTSVYGMGHLVYYHNVIRVLQGFEQPATDGREGLASLELLIAAYRAARDGTMVSLPLEL